MLDLLLSAAGKVGDMFMANKQANKQAALQKEFAQSGIQWKVEDAKKAGIHPLYALGANTISYSPSNVGTSDLSGMGQDIGRAINATRDTPSKAGALAQTLAQAQIEGVRLDNDIKRADLASKIATQNSTGVTPGLPNAATRWFMDGQGNGPQAVPGSTLDYTRKIDPPEPGQPSVAAGASPEVILYKTGRGYSPQIPQALSESFEADWVSKWQWLLRNKLLPESMGGVSNPPRNVKLPPGWTWDYDALAGEYFPRARDRYGYKWRSQ